MFERSVLKDNAKRALSNYYWKGFLVCLLTGIIVGLFDQFLSSVLSVYLRIGIDSSSYYYEYSFKEVLLNIFGLKSMISLIVLFIFLYLMVLAYRLFIANIVAVGRMLFFIRSRSDYTDISVIFEQFKKGKFASTFLAIFFQQLFIGLWSLLLVIPGMIKSYQYYFVPFIMAEYPEMHWKDALERSAQMTADDKWNLFVLDLSFIGWDLLCVLTLGIGSFFLEPYRTATQTEAYYYLKQKVAHIRK